MYNVGDMGGAAVIVASLYAIVAAKVPTVPIRVYGKSEQIERREIWLRAEDHYRRMRNRERRETRGERG